MRSSLSSINFWYRDCTIFANIPATPAKKPMTATYWPIIDVEIVSVSGLVLLARRVTPADGCSEDVGLAAAEQVHRGIDEDPDFLARSKGAQPVEDGQCRNRFPSCADDLAGETDRDVMGDACTDVGQHEFEEARTEVDI